MRVTKFIVQNCQRIYTPSVMRMLLNSLTPNEMKLFEVLSEGRITNDDDLCTYIYGDVKDNNSSYSRLKRKLSDKIADMHIINVSGNKLQGDRKKAKKLGLLVESLQLEGNRPELIKACLVCFSEAKKIGMNDLAADMCRRISLHYMQYDHKASKALKYRKLYQEYNTKRDSEIEAEWMYAQSVKMSEGKTGINNDIADVVATMKASIKLDHDSGSLHFFYFALGIKEYALRGDIDARIAECKKGLDFFANLHYKHNLAISIFRRRLINAYIDAGQPHQLAMSENLIHREILEDDKTDHQRLMLRYELAHINIKLTNYRKALTVLESIDYKKLSSQIKKEQLLIDILYLQILLREDNINFQSTNRKCRESKKEINGARLQLLVAECLCHHLSGHAWKVEDKTSKLKKSILDLDQVKQAHWINLLYELMGSDMRLDESGADRSGGRWVVGVDVLRGAISKKNHHIPR